jgi:hypothetical protein
MPAWFAPSLIGLLGGLLGVVLGTALSVWTSDRAEARQQARALRTAERLVRAEVRHNHIDLWAFTAADDNVSQLRLLTTDAWEAQSATLASNLDDADWATVDEYYSELETIVHLAAGVSPNLRWIDFEGPKGTLDQARLGNDAYVTAQDTGDILVALGDSKEQAREFMKKYEP